MKNALRLIIAIALLWIVGLMVRSSAGYGHILLDHVLPERVLAQTSADERITIAERLSHRGKPKVISWIAPVAILLLASYTLLAANRAERRP